MAVQEKYWKPDGLSGVYIKELSGGVETGEFMKWEGAKSVTAKKAQNQRTILADNLVYSDTTKYQKFDIVVTLAAVRPDQMKYMAPGALTVEPGEKLGRFKESSKGQPTQFNLYVFSDSDENGGGLAVLPRIYKNCRTQSLDADSNSGDYGDIVLAISGLSDADDVVREWVFDEDLVGVDVSNSGDTTKPTVSDVSASVGTWPGAVGTAANILIDFSEEMKSSTLVAANVIIKKISDNSTVAAAYSYATGSPFRLTVNPTASLSSTSDYWVRVRTLVQDLAGNYMAEEYSEVFTTA